MAWFFRPPTVDDGPRFRSDADRVTVALFSRFVGPTRGRTVYRTGGTFVTSDAPYLDDLLAADAVYYGGHVTPVSDAEKAELEAAGFGAYLSESP
jgi:hypothetical protein